MMRMLFFLLSILAVALALSSIADQPGKVSVIWLGYEIETSVFIALLAFAALLGACALLWSLFRYILTRPAALSRYVKEKQEERGLDALSQGLIAIGSGDKESARRYASLARRRLPNEPLTGLLRAQSAQLSGDRAEATRIFEAMTERPGTELLGLRGLFLEARREEETEAACQFAERAMHRNPGLAWSVNALFELQCRAGDWGGALRTLDVARRQKHVDKQTGDRRRGVLLMAQAREAEDQDSGHACKLALEALALAPDLVPAAAMAGRLIAAQGNVSRARRLLTKAWERKPHPDLALAYAYLVPGEPPRDRLMRVKKLTQARAENAEGRFALALAATDARGWDEARAALIPLTADNPTSRVCTLMARIEAGDKGDEGRVREWLTRAVRAPRDPAWTADGFVSEVWEPVSPVTGRLDAFEWKVPVESLTLSRDGEAPAGEQGYGENGHGGMKELGNAGGAVSEREDADHTSHEPMTAVAPEPEPIPEPHMPDKDPPGNEVRADADIEHQPGALIIEAEPIIARSNLPLAPEKGQQQGNKDESGKAGTGVSTDAYTPLAPEIYVPPRAPDDPGPDAPESDEQAPAPHGNQSPQRDS